MTTVYLPTVTNWQGNSRLALPAASFIRVFLSYHSNSPNHEALHYVTLQLRRVWTTHLSPSTRSYQASSHHLATLSIPVPYSATIPPVPLRAATMSERGQYQPHRKSSSTWSVLLMNKSWHICQSDRVRYKAALTHLMRPKEWHKMLW